MTYWACTVLMKMSPTKRLRTAIEFAGENGLSTHRVYVHPGRLVMRRSREGALVEQRPSYGTCVPYDGHRDSLCPTDCKLHVT